MRNLRLLGPYSNSGARAITLGLSILFLFLSLASAATAASLDKFTGTWKENESKRKLGPLVALKFRLDAKGNLEELRGADARPLVQPVRFGAKAYTIDNSDNSIAWKQIDKTHFERTLFAAGKVLTVRHIKISDDGKTLTEVTDLTLTNGRKDVTTIEYHRTKGDGPGLPGVWQAVSLHSTIPAEIKYEAMGDHLKMLDDRGVTFNVGLDGKPVEVTGPGVISGTMVAMKQSDPQTLEMAQSRQGVATGKTTMSISADGKVMTVTAINLAPDASHEPSVTVFDKQ